jgi:methyltransferase (TIGR00027 family)
VNSNRASSTAVLIARSMVYMSRHPAYAGLVPAESAQWCEALLVDHAGGSRNSINRLSRTWFRASAELLQGWLQPGMLPHYALRKRCIASLARVALRQGISQLVVLGAGFDPLARVLHSEFPQASFWEIDHPATQAAKRRVCEPGAPRLHFVPMDFAAAPFAPVLLAPTGFNPRHPTLWIAEGLLMYFPAAIVRALLAALRDSCPRDSRLVLTFMETPAHGPIRFRQQSRLVDYWLRQREETFAWAEAPDSLGRFLAPLGFQLERCFGPDDLRALAPGFSSRLAEGEWIAEAIAT